jgi:hypothetical protein
VTNEGAMPVGIRFVTFSDENAMTSISCEDILGACRTLHPTLPTTLPVTLPVTRLDPKVELCYHKSLKLRACFLAKK